MAFEYDEICEFLAEEADALNENLVEVIGNEASGHCLDAWNSTPAELYRDSTYRALLHGAELGIDSIGSRF